MDDEDPDFGGKRDENRSERVFALRFPGFCLFEFEIQIRRKKYTDPLLKIHLEQSDTESSSGGGGAGGIFFPGLPPPSASRGSPCGKLLIPNEMHCLNHYSPTSETFPTAFPIKQTFFPFRLAEFPDR